MTASETKLTSLLDFLPSWAKEANDGQCLLQFFVSFFDVKNIQRIGEINRNYERVELRHPSFMRIIELSELKLVGVQGNTFSKPRDGPLHFMSRLEERVFPPGVYAVLGAPFDTNNSHTNEGDAKATLSALAAMIALLYGFAALHSKTAEISINIKTGQYSFSSPVIENPTFFKIDHLKDVPLDRSIDISRRITAASSEINDLVSVSLTYLDRAIREPHHGIRLSLYFSAIEVLTGEVSTNKMCSALETPHIELREMGYDELLKRRTLFVHRGKNVSINREEERFLQHLLVDVISTKLGFEKTSFARDYIMALRNHMQKR
jgi:hypothetical protein